MTDNIQKSTNVNTSCLKWDFSFQKMSQNQVSDPPGFGVNIIEGLDNRSKKLEVAKTKTNKAKDLAWSQGKSIFMTLISLYFIGSNLSLITIFIIGLYAYNGLMSLLNVNNAFKLYENHEFSIFQYKLIYCFFQTLTFTFIMYRIFNLGLLPLNPSDWISMIDNTIPESKVIPAFGN